MSALAAITVPAGAQGWDCSNRLTRVVLEAAKASGMRYVMKYAPYGTRDRDKFWHADELALCAEVGIAVGCNGEIEAARAVTSPEKGAGDGTTWRTRMRALGYPDGAPIFIAVDTGVGTAQKPAVARYLTGACSTIGTAGVYGGSVGIRIGATLGAVGCITVAAWGWSPEFAGPPPVAQRVAISATIPDVRIVQYPSTTRWGIAIDPLVAIKPVVFAGVPVAPIPIPIPPTPTPIAAVYAASGGANDMDFYWVGNADNKADPTRYLWNGMVLRRPTDQAEADEIAAAFKVGNTLAAPRWWSKAQIDSFLLANHA